MAFFTSAISTLQTLVVALGAGLGVWGVINLLEGYGNDNPGAKSQGMKQLMAGGGVASSASPWFPCCPACSPSLPDLPPRASQRWYASPPPGGEALAFSI